jgi:ABC-2 type transport system permease protein
VRDPRWLAFRNQFLGFVREPAAAIFNLLLPIFIVVIQGAAFGREDVPDLPGSTVVDTLPVTASAIFIMIIGVFGVSIGLATMRSSRSLDTYRFYPGGGRRVVTAYLGVLVLLIVVGVAISVALLVGFWDVRPTPRVWALVLFGLVGVWGFLGLGAAVAGLVPTPRSAQGVASAIFFPLLFLSGAVFPLSQVPEGLQRIAEVLPGSHLYDVLAYSWLGDWDGSETGSMIYLAVFAVVTGLAGPYLAVRRTR